jgi:hypothetical protein
VKAKLPEHVYLVGSVGLDSAKDVFRTVSRAFRRRLRRVPDGEPGPRRPYSGITANVHSEPPVGTALPMARRARPPPKPDATVTYCRPLWV